jgi:glycosyltransferase involved in cell wall biosynthesis
MPQLSIITINLNNASGLNKTSESIIDQTFTDFEWIVIDGGSFDGSFEIIQKNIDKINYWVSEPDNGIYNAMNKGIKHSNGEYCFFLNSGDYFVNERVLENVFEKKNTEDVVVGNLLVLFNNKVVGKSKGKEEITFLDVYSSLIKHQAAFIRKNMFDKFGMYNEELKIISDWDFFLKTVGLGGASYKYIDIDVACFDNNGISNNNEIQVAHERQIVIDTYLPPMMQKDYDLLLKNQDFEIVTKYSIPFVFLRLLAKTTKIYETLFLRK